MSLEQIHELPLSEITTSDENVRVHGVGRDLYELAASWRATNDELSSHNVMKWEND
jgi:hypothetical protein